MGTKFSSHYRKGDQLFNCYGRRTNRFLLINYGFCLRHNKYNSLGFKVFVNFDNEEQKSPNDTPVEKQQFQKVIRMKLNRLSLDLLQYLRANLVFSFHFKSPEVRNLVTVSSPVDTDFEIFVLDQAIQLIQSMIKTKYPTSLDFDLKILDMLTHDDESEELPLKADDPDLPKIQELISQRKDHLWRYKLALLHRVNQKEILHDQLKHVKILRKILANCKKLIEVAQYQAKETNSEEQEEDAKEAPKLS